MFDSVVLEIIPNQIEYYLNTMALFAYKHICKIFLLEQSLFYISFSNCLQLNIEQITNVSL